MVHPWITVLVAILYISILFAVASYGDRVRARSGRANVNKPNIYALSLAVYCTTWTFFGSVGLATTSGLNFLAIYVGPVLMVTVGYPILRKIVTLSREERITSVADFLGSRYGKDDKVAAVAAIIAVIGTVPYIALQLKAISASVQTLHTEFGHGFPIASAPFGDITLLVTLTLAAFGVLFGTRHADATEHQHGMMLAIAMESVIKLIAFLFVGAFVTWIMFDGMTDLFARAIENERIQGIVSRGFDAGNFAILTLLSTIVFLLLPRQFHVTVVENTSEGELRRARWLFPLYLVAINLFVLPIAIAGILKFGISANADDYVLLLPILDGQVALGLLVFIGGLSAGTAMVIVASIALAIMISNDLVLPLLLKARASRGNLEPVNMERRILNIRRTSIFAVLGLAYAYYSAADNTAALASIGLVSFAAIAQLAPAFFLGMIWKEANARGAILGMIGGFIVWAYCLLLPTLLPESNGLVMNGPFGIAMLKPENLFGLELSAIANGVIWSLVVNTALLFAGSNSRMPEARETFQAARFVSFQDQNPQNSVSSDSSVRVSNLTETLSRYLGEERTRRSFEAYASERGIATYPQRLVDGDMLRFSEQLLASAVGASSSRLVHTLLIQRHERTNLDNLQLLDEASRAIQFNRDMLQTAFDQLEQGITVFDGENRLASWNRRFRHILGLPDSIGRAGLSMNAICDAIIESNDLERIGMTSVELGAKLQDHHSLWQLKLPLTKRVLEISTSPMPEGGTVITWHDITERVKAAEALHVANETLEKRVVERTHELEEAKQLADQANISKTRFLAAAGHDIVQPLNAARLYVSTLLEQKKGSKSSALTENISKSLASVEEILGSVLAISKLDTAHPEVNISNFPLRRITEQLEIEFEPIAKNANLDLRIVHSSAWVRTDPALFRRLLQNLISNALKFTRSGRVLVGPRRSADGLKLCVYDTGVGMSEKEQEVIFQEFTRLDTIKNEVPGLGLGLSIVERIADLLGHEVGLDSTPGSGTMFSVSLPRVAAEKENTGTVRRLRGAASQHLGGMHVLCIDNEPSILEGMEALLSQWGCNVICAADLKEAKSRLAKAKTEPRVVIVDYHLDRTTGVEVFDKLVRKMPNRPSGILVTADRSEQVKLLAAENDLALLNKPVKPAALRAILSQLRHTGIAAE